MMNMDRPIPYLPNLPVYQKALEIFSLSRRVASYVSYDRSILELQNTADFTHQKAGTVVLTSLNLAPSIAAVALQTNPYYKRRCAKRLARITHRLVKACEHLESKTAEGKEFVALLSTEIQKFKKLQQSWLSSLN